MEDAVANERLAMQLLHFSQPRFLFNTGGRITHWRHTLRDDSKSLIAKPYLIVKAQRMSTQIKRKQISHSHLKKKCLWQRSSMVCIISSCASKGDNNSNNSIIFFFHVDRVLTIRLDINLHSRVGHTTEAKAAYCNRDTAGSIYSYCRLAYAHTTEAASHDNAPFSLHQEHDGDIQLGIL